jgi:hypothetical protein
VYLKKQKSKKQNDMKNNTYKILVLSDFKKKSIGILRYSAKLSKEINAEVECFHVEELRAISQLENPFSVSHAIRDTHKKMNKRLKEFIDPISDANGIKITSNFVFGNIKNEIATHILTTKPDMIILGERTPKKFRLFSDNILSIVQKNFNGVVFVATDDNTLDENGNVSLDNLGLKNNISKYTKKPKEKIKV